ncbi:MAG: FliH/SctL family protein [Armatimonadia bacterium]
MAQLLKNLDPQTLPAAVQPLYEPFAELVREPTPVASAPPVPEPETETLNRHLRLINRVMAELVQEQERLLGELRPSLLRLVLALAEEVIRREVAVDRTVVERTLQEALQHLHFATRVVVRVHPDDLEHLQAQPGLLEQCPLELAWQADTEIEPGGCRLSTDRGGVDATIGTQLRNLAQALQATHS